ncbi:Ig-like domain-containing protein [uncultured Methanobrevibacter sp.]|uniref:Ig-like domain-containing protein n=1 Tax=uncultured Methanobrevibacter sp. TaxID=253161 RepID=UPI002603E338|nr:Ig-like domain-containing protein [uncultured Methanobrevibacter sp.]
MKKIFIISIMLIMLSMGFTSASDNITDDLTFPDNQDIELNTDFNENIAIHEDDSKILSENENTIVKKDMNATVSFPNEIVKSMTLHVNSYELKINCPKDYRDGINIYVDDALIEENYQYRTYGLYGFEYDLGQHAIRVNFPENDIYKELNVTTNFTVVETLISISCPENVIYVGSKTASDVKGNLTIYVNDTVYKKVDLSKISDRASGFSMQLNDLDIGTYKITVIYSGDGKYKKAEKTEIVTKSYLIYTDSELYFYGPKIFKIHAPIDIKNKKIDVIIDGKNYPAEFDSEWEEFNVDVSDLSFGKHNYTVTYQGDSKYPKKTIEGEINLYASIKSTSTQIYGENSTFSINIPTNESGNFSLYISKRTINTTTDLYATSPLINGTATITLPSLDVGEYRIYVEYKGATNVKSIADSFTVMPKVIYPDEMTYGKDTPIYFVGDKNANGVITLTTFEQDSEGGDYERYFTTTMVNGSGNYTLKNLKIHRHLFDVEYRNETTYLSGMHFYITVNELTPVFSNNKDISMYYYDGSAYQIKLKDETGRYLSDRLVTFKIGSKTYKVMTEEKGIGKLQIKELPGTYTITATYKGATVKNKITVKKILTLTTVKVKKSAKKLVLQAKLAKKLKGKQITFKFNGKSYKVKTDKNGIAKVTVPKSVLSKLKVGKTLAYQATYVKQTVKKTVKVQK